MESVTFFFKLKIKPFHWKNSKRVGLTSCSFREGERKANMSWPYYQGTFSLASDLSEYVELIKRKQPF